MAKWVKGQSGNPGGRPKGYGSVRALAQEHTESAVKTLVTIMEDDKAAPSARTAAASALLDRGWGRPGTALSTDQDNSMSFIEMLKRLDAEESDEDEDELADA